MQTEREEKKPIGFRVLQILAIVSILVLLFPFVLDLVHRSGAEAPASVSEPYSVTVRDNAKLLTEYEKKDLAETMKSVAAYHPVAFVSTRNTEGNTTLRYAELLFDELFPEKDGILFLIDMQNRNIWLQKANNNRVLTTALCNTVTDNVYREASAGNYFQCANRAYKQVYKILKGDKVPETMKHLSNLFLSVAAALFLVFLFAAKGTGVLRPKQVFDVDDNMQRKLSIRNVKKRFKRLIVHRSADSSSDSFSSGGSFGGGGGGGFSSGGGGGGGSSSSGGGHSF